MGTVIKIKELNIYPSSFEQRDDTVKIEPLFGELKTTFFPPDVGQPWPEQGGVFAGSMPAENEQPRYYLIVPADPAAESELTWATTRDTSVDDLSACDGKANTEKLVASEVDHPAAKFCAALSLNGFTDYYLPARREASLMAATVPHLFTPGYHWTSTQYSANNAFVQDFSDGYQDYGTKGYEWRVRAVRRVIY